MRRFLNIVLLLIIAFVPLKGLAQEPEHNVTNFMIDFIGENDISLYWDNASGGGVLPTDYLIIAYEDGFYPGSPVDLTTYPDEMDFSDGVGYANISHGCDACPNAYPFTNLKSNTHYSFEIYAYTEYAAGVTDYYPIFEFTQGTTAGINLFPGAIAFTSSFGDSPDSFSFVLLKDVEPGTLIFFTDHGWSDIEDDFTYHSDDQMIIWEALDYIYAGTEFVIEQYNIFPAGLASVDEIDGTPIDMRDGDQILAFQGNPSNPFFIAAINMDGEWRTGVPSGDRTRSALPPGLIEGENAISFAQEWDNAGYRFYDFPMTGTPSSLLTQIMGTTVNWNMSNIRGDIVPPPGGYDVYILPPDLTGLIPLNGSITNFSSPILQIIYDDNISKDLATGGSININIAGGANTLSYDITSPKISVAGNVVNIDISSDLGSLVSGTTYEVFVDGFMFVNPDGNHNQPIYGFEWEFTYDAEAPTLSEVYLKSNNIDPTQAKEGEEITLTFTSDQVLSSSSNVSFLCGGNPITNSPTALNSVGLDYSISYITHDSDTDGPISFIIEYYDEVGNQGIPVSSTTDGLNVTYDDTPPTGYSITIDQTFINTSNETALSFTFSGAEPEATYNYSIDDTNGGTIPVIGNGTIATTTDQISGIDVSSLDDDNLTLTVYLTDPAGNQGSNVTGNILKETVAPSGYSVSIDQAYANISTETAMSFTFASAEVGAIYNYSIDDSNGGTAPVTGSGTITSTNDQISGINVSSLDDGNLTLTVYLTDPAGNQGSNETDIVTKDTSAPSGYSVSIDQAYVNISTETAMSFTFASAEVGAIYNYSIDDSNGGTAPLTGNGTIANLNDQISGINVSSLDDGNLTLTVYLTDPAGNQGNNVTDNVTKETVVPSGYSVSFDQLFANQNTQNGISFTFAGAESGTTYDYIIDDTDGGTTAIAGTGTIVTANDQVSGINVSSLNDELLTLTVTLTDTYGNTGNSVTDQIAKDVGLPILNNVSIVSNHTNSSWARVGSLITLSLQADEPLKENPAVNFYSGGVTVGDIVTISDLGGNNYSAEFTTLGTHTEGTITFTINFMDVAGNAGTMVSATTDLSSVTLDKTPPTVIISVSEDPIYQLALIQTVTLSYNEEMDPAYTPVIDGIIGTSWSSQVNAATPWTTDTNTNDTFTANFTHDGTEEGPINLDVSTSGSSGAVDLAGNPAVTGGPVQFVVDTRKPVVNSILASDLLLTDNDAGVDAFSITIEYGEDMNTLVNPVVSFPNEDPATTLLNQGGSWSSATQYIATFDVVDDNVDLSNIDVSISGAVDADIGNPQTVYTESDVFSINTTNATVLNLTSTISGDGTYIEFDEISIDVEFDRIINVTGTPEITMNAGGSALYDSGTGTNTLIFKYIPQPGQSTADLDAASESALTLEGGSLLDDIGNHAILTLPIPGNAGSLSTNHDIVIDLLNHQPLIDAITDPAAIDEDAGIQTISFTGVDHNEPDGVPQQNITVMATSSDTNLIPDPTVSYTLNGTSGSLSYTPVADANGTATITVKVKDDAGTDHGGIDSVMISFNVVINPINDAPTISDAVFAIDENSANGTAVGTMVFGDVDAGDSHTFTITFGNTNNAFAIDNTGVLTVNDVNELNFELISSYTLTIQVTDDGTNNLSATATANVTVNDVNDAPSNIEISSNRVLEGSSAGTVIGYIQASDEDGDTDITYSLPSGELDNSKFIINSGNALTTGGILLLSDNPLSILVRAADQIGDYSEQVFTIEVVSSTQNLAPTKISLSNQDISELNLVNDEVGTFSSEDPNPGDTHNYSLVAGEGDFDNASFSIVSTNSLQTNVVFDYETKSTYSIRVRSSDGQDYLEDTFIINVLDVTYPDLIVSNITLTPGTVQAGEIVNVKAIINNQTSQGIAQGTLNSKLFLSSNITYNSADQGIDLSYSGGSPAISGNSFAQLDGDVTIPVNTTGDTYYLYLVLDPDNTIDETEDPADDSQEQNNVGSSTIVVTGETTRPVITPVSIPATYTMGGGDISLSVEVTDNSGDIQDVKFTFRGSSESESSNNEVFLTATGNQYSTTVAQSMLDDLGLYFRFDATDNAGNTAIPYEGIITITSSINQPEAVSLVYGGNQADYQIISIPYQMDDPRIASVFVAMGAADKTKWRLLQHKSSGECCNEFPSQLSQIKQGEGYWLIIKDETVIELGARETPEAGPGDPFDEIVLVNGWNQIGNPYPFDISWPQVETHNGNPDDLGPLWTWNKQWNKNSSTLKEWQGGFVEWNGPDGFVLEIPVEANTATAGRIMQHRDIKEPGWEINLNLSNDELQLDWFSLGMSPEASFSRDFYDESTPPRFFDYLEVNFYQPSNDHDRFCRDIVPLSNYHEWNFTVESNIAQKAILSWDAPALINHDQNFILQDLTSNQVINMKEMSSYEVNNVLNHPMRIYYGEMMEIEDNLRASIMSLGNAYPNPFDDFTVIPFALPQGSEYSVHLSIYSANGTLIKELINGKLNPGFYEIEWDGNDSKDQKVAGGMYLYRLQVLQGEKIINMSKKLIKR